MLDRNLTKGFSYTVVFNVHIYGQLHYICKLDKVDGSRVIKFQKEITDALRAKNIILKHHKMYFKNKNIHIDKYMNSHHSHHTDWVSIIDNDKLQLISNVNIVKYGTTQLVLLQPGSQNPIINDNSADNKQFNHNKRR